MEEIKQADKWYLSKRYWAAALNVLSVVCAAAMAFFPAMPSCKLTPWVPAIMAALAILAGGLSVWSRVCSKEKL